MSNWEVDQPMKFSVPLIFLTLALWSSHSAAQEFNCAMSHQVRLIGDVSALPSAVRDALRADSLYPYDGSTAGPRFHGAGQYGEYYFVWSSKGDRISFETISLYRMAAGDKTPVMIARDRDQWTMTKEVWCQRTDSLLTSYLGHPN